MTLKSLWSLIKLAGGQWMEDKAPRLGAALAYYMIFSLAPLLVIAIGIAGLVFGREIAQARISNQIAGVVGDQGGKAIDAMVESAGKPGTGALGTILGILMLVFGASGLFGQIQDALNTVWEVQPKPGQGVWGFIRTRFLSFSMVLVVAFLLLVSLVISAALAALGTLFGDWKESIVGILIQVVIDFCVITPLFALIFRFLPDAKVAWKDVWLGAALTAVLFLAGKFLIGLYLGRAGVASGYGAAGSLAVLLVWLYYATQIFLFGAEFTKAYANQFGSRIVPKEHAEIVTEEARAQQGIPQNGSHKEAKEAKGS